jgi:phosphoglycolate phosphatase-like HAD superfamily hydrolase
MLKKIMQAQGVLPTETIMVGDAGNDVIMAQAAGVEPIVVLTGHLNEREAHALGVRHVIPDVTKIEDVLSRC